MQRLKIYVTIFIVAVGFYSCEKDTGLPANLAPASNEAARQVASCDATTYADTIFYVKDDNNNYIVTPKKVSSGVYSASPAGLQINSSTGAINVSTSETGLRYKVFFIPKGTKDTCSSYITISGVDYQSAVYSLSSRDTVANPTYYGRSKAGIPTGSEFDDVADDKSIRAVG